MDFFGYFLFHRDLQCQTNSRVSSKSQGFEDENKEFFYISGKADLFFLNIFEK